MFNGTFIVAKKALDKKKHPIGMLALPKAASVAMKTHKISSKGEKVIPFKVEGALYILQVRSKPLYPVS